MRFSIMTIRLTMVFCFFLLRLTGQSIEEYTSFDDFEQNLMTPNSSKVYVINYWATWCAPCVKEIPYFERLNRAYQSDSVEVVLVSLDFKSDFEKRLKPFVNKHQLRSRIIHMADPNSNDWIDRIDKDWQGTIPITIFVRGQQRLFIDQEFASYEDLEEQLTSFITSK